jgi:hypothetical protein
LWATRVAGGIGFPTGGAVRADTSSGATVVADAGPGPLVAFDIARFVGCRVELQGGVDIQFSSIHLSAGGSAAGDRVQLSGLHIALAYHPWQFRRGDVYFGPLMGGVSRDRAVVATPAGASAITLPGGWGVGVHAGYRLELRRRLAFDANIRWQNLRMPIAGGARLDYNPLVVTAGVVFRH